MRGIVYKKSNGLIVKYVTCPDSMISGQYDSSAESFLEWGNCITTENYVVNGAPVYVAPPDPDPPTLEGAKATKKSEMAVARLIEEESGINLPSGVHIDTDRVAQWQMASALITFRSGFVTSTKWKTNGIWVDITLPQLEVIAAAVAQHVEACFAKEEALWATIDACTTVEEVEAITW